MVGSVNKDNKFEEQLTVLESCTEDIGQVENLKDVLRRLNSLQREIFKAIEQRGGLMQAK